MPIYLAMLLIGLSTIVICLIYWFEKKLMEINFMFREIKDRLKALETEFKDFNHKFKFLETRLNKMGNDLGNLNRLMRSRFNKFDHRFKVFDERLSQISNAIRFIDEFIIDILNYEM